MFKNNVVIITGASTGIGEELAYQLSRQGAHLVLSARRVNELERVAARVKQIYAQHGHASADVICVGADVAIAAQCKALIDATMTHFGRIDTLVNNAGMSMWARFANIADITILERIMQVNYMGAVYCTHYALPHLQAVEGRIVGIASLAGLVGVPTRTGYAASKHAMRGFFDSLRIELADTGVSVTMVYPGFVGTGIRENATGADGKAAAIDPVDPRGVMTPATCVRLIVQAMAARKREEVMTLKGKLGQWLRLVAPQIVDSLARKAVAGNAVKVAAPVTHK